MRMVGVYANDVELTNRILVDDILMDLGPDKTNYFIVFCGEEET